MTPQDREETRQMLSDNSTNNKPATLEFHLFNRNICFLFSCVSFIYKLEENINLKY